jgi:hypothetical protein
MKKTAPAWWYNYKIEKTFADARKELMADGLTEKVLGLRL